MATRIKPPFRADQVGSLLRPKSLIDARERQAKGEMTAGELAAFEDDAIRQVVKLQEQTGIQSITDGEYRRASWRDGFFNHVDGFSKDRNETVFEHRLTDGTVRKAVPVPRVIGKLRRREGIGVPEFRFLKTVTTKTPKLTMPAPSVMHFFGGAGAIDKTVYPSVEAYMSDVAAIYREEIAELYGAGCTYLQLDEVALPILCDPVNQAKVEARGDKLGAVIDLYVDTLNQAIRDKPSGMTICLHMCRGNVGEGVATGGYEPIAERAFGRMNVDGFFMEYDTPRAGDFQPLRHVPKGKQIVLGLVSSKLPALESIDSLKRRVDEAAVFAEADQLCLSPQCGFASGFRYSHMTIDDEMRKLSRVVEAADRIWN